MTATAHHFGLSLGGLGRVRSQVNLDVGGGLLAAHWGQSAGVVHHHQQRIATVLQRQLQLAQHTAFASTRAHRSRLWQNKGETM